MKFDVKDVKSWANRHDVKAGDKGYLSDDISSLCHAKDAKASKLDRIYDNKGDCFSAIDCYGTYSFFLPLDAVKEDKPKEKKYRPIKSLSELAIAFYGVPNYFQHICVGGNLFVKYKNDKNYKRVLITSLEFDENNALSTINGITLRAWFDHYELRNDKGEWVPFGVEENDDE
jgi:hypothetical protein